MRRLLLLRHAKTESDAPSGRDQDRRLDARGHRDAAEIGGWIARHPPFPDHVMVSPAMRAKASITPVITPEVAVRKTMERVVRQRETPSP